MSHSYDQSGVDQYITIVALADNTEVRIQRPDEEVFNGNGGSGSNVQVYVLNNRNSVRYVSYLHYITIHAENLANRRFHTLMFY